MIQFRFNNNKEAIQFLDNTFSLFVCFFINEYAFNSQDGEPKSLSSVKNNNKSKIKADRLVKLRSQSETEW